MSFEQWLHEVDLLCFAWYGRSIHDLPDMEFRGAYDADIPAEQFMLEELGTLTDLSHLILS